MLSPVFLVNSRFTQLYDTHRAFLIPKLRNYFAEFLKYSYSKSFSTFMPDHQSQNETILLNYNYFIIKNKLIKIVYITKYKIIYLLLNRFYKYNRDHFNLFQHCITHSSIVDTSIQVHSAT